jgi:DNA modification methylase
MQAYADFLRSKIVVAPETGFDVPPEEIHPVLKPHQRDAVRWALRGGQRALFEAFGLGKTVQELEFCRIVLKHLGGKALIVLPLGVKLEFQRDACQLLGLEEPQYIRNMEEAMAAPMGSILLTNYERVRDGDIDPALFTAASLDEAAILRSFGSDTYQTFLPKFRGVRFKLVCTATPSPNRFKELIHYAGYLEVMDTGQALTRFFQRDSTKANNLTLYPHKETEFWLWVSSWALFISKPSDLGYSDEGYDLPPLEVRYHEIPVDHATAGADRDGQMKLIRDAALSLPDAAREKRESIGARVAMMKQIVDADPDAHFILWHDLEEERHAIRRALPESVDIWGSQDLDEREQRTLDFSDGKIRLFATKKRLSGCGANFQRHCHRAIFVGIDHKFHDFIQAIHRIYRFLQTEKVIIDVIYTESERQILQDLLEKWKQHEYLQERMREIIMKYGLASANISIMEKMARTIGVERVEVKGSLFRAINNDCILETAAMEGNSVDLIVTSIPFSNHYEYTPSYNDFGHNPDTERFMEQMDFLSPELLRVLRPGRVMCIHVKDRVLFGNATGTGMPTMEPFHALCIQHYMRHGFQYFGMITVVTDVVRENNQTYRLGWTEQCKDGTKMGVGCPEYILLFRKLPSDTGKAYADVPVAKTKAEYTRAQWQIDAHGYWRSSGDRLLTKAELMAMPTDRLQEAYRRYSRATVYNYQEHVELAKKLDADGRLPATFMVVAPGSWTDQVWDDINRMRTLNTQQSQRRQQMHVCPLQIDIVERLINRYSNPGDVVMDPFAGLFTVPERAVRMGRYGIGVELNVDYFRDGVGYLKAAEETASMPTLFDLIPGGRENAGHQNELKEA